MADLSYRREMARKFLHFLSIFYLLLYFGVAVFFGHQIALFVMVFFLIIVLLLECMRLQFNVRVPVLSYIWKHLRREKEEKMIGAEIYLLLGMILALSVFEIRIATAAILMTIFGDLAAALVGKKYGSIKIVEGKSLQGSLAELFANMLIGYLFIRTTVDGSIWWLRADGGFGMFGSPIWPAIIVMALTATLSEVFIRKIDDNLTIPLFSGFVGHLVLFFLV